MSASGIIILILFFYLQTQTLAADNANAIVDQMINSSMQTSAEPCEDAYSYACGNYNEQTFFNSTLKSKNLLNYANQQYNAAIIKLLHERHEVAGNCPALTEKVRNYFESCRKVVKRNLIRYLEEMKPGPDINWPILESANSNSNNNVTSKWPHNKDFDVLHLVARLNSLGISDLLISTYFYRAAIYIEPMKVRVNDVSSLPNITAMRNMLLYMGIEDPANILEDVLETDKILLDILDAKKNYDLPSVNVSIGDLAKLLPNLNFKSLLEIAMKEKQMPLNTSIVLQNVPFFQELNDKMLSLFEQRMLCNYLMIQYLMRFYTTANLDDMFCADELRRVFQLAVNYLYYQHNVDHLEKVVKPDVKEIYETVADMLEKHVRSNDLKLKSHQIASFKENLSSIRFNIGDLPDNAACATIAELYASVPQMDANNYYKNHLIMTRFKLRKRREPHFLTLISDVPVLQGITYNEGYGEPITLNYAYLMPVVYDSDYNDLHKYSLLGFILATVLVRSCGIVYIKNNGSEFSQPFEDAIRCFAEQQGITKYTFLRADIADDVACEVVRKIVTLKFFNKQPLESVAYWKKRFFLNVAQHYCGAHSYWKMDRFTRVLMNSEAFSQAFHCSESSKMNPREKCQLQ